jgi:hypothetical protein
VPPREGCRLPSRIGARPVASWLAPNVGDLPPSLHEHYTRFVNTTGQSAPLRRIGTFGLAVGAACAFSLGIAGQVLTFRTRARLSFAPPLCRMPLGQSQDIPQTDPGGMATLRFWHRLIRFRDVISSSLALASLNHACRNLSDFSATFTTIAFDDSSSRWLGISDLIADLEGPSFISHTVAHRRMDRRYS